MVLRLQNRAQKRKPSEEVPSSSATRSLASNFRTRERANSSLDQNDTKMISEEFIKSDAKW